MTTSDHILTEKHDAIQIITFNRPDKKNAFTQAMYAAITHALGEADADPAVRVVLLRGAGNIFTAGNDIADFAGGGGKLDAALALLMQLVDQQKPIVAAVDGPAIGIGTTLLLHADYIAASTRARFQLPFVNLGLVPEGGSSLLLPALVGLARASEWLLLGEPIEAEAARAAGLVNAVVAPEELPGFALARAQAIAARPAGAVASTRRLLRERMRGELRETIKREGELFVERLQTPEALEAMQSFLSRRR